MNKKEIKKFYLSLIDNPEAIWSIHTNDDLNLIEINCIFGNIKILTYQPEYQGYQLVFRYTGKNSNDDDVSITSYKDIGISKFRSMFPYFGIIDRIKRRIKSDYIRETKNYIAQLRAKELNKVSSILTKDKL